MAGTIAREGPAQGDTRALRRGLRDLNRILRPQYGVTLRRVLTLEEWRRVAGAGWADADRALTDDGIVVPIRRAGVVVGAVDVEVGPAGGDDDAVLRLAAAACAVMLEGTALRRRARDAERRLAAVSERERIARGVNDTVGERIGTIGRRVARHLADTHEGPWRRRLEELLELSYEADRDVREAVHALLFLDARRERLVPSLHALAGRFEATTGSSCDVRVSGEPAAMSEAREDALFRVTHEALVNIQRHARASAVGISVEFGRDEVTLVVRDDGVGIARRDPFAMPGRFGLRTMRDRVRHVGGVLHVSAAQPRGVVIEAVVPVRQRRARASAGAGSRS